MQHKPLNGKVAIVTGAGSPIGMGRAMTFALVQAGARVAMLDINEEWLEQSAGEVRAAGGGRLCPGFGLRHLRPRKRGGRGSAGR